MKLAPHGAELKKWVRGMPDGRDVKSDLLTTAEAAELLRISEVSLKRMRYRKEGPAWTTVGSRVLYRPEVVRAWIEAQTVDLSR